VLRIAAVKSARKEVIGSDTTLRLAPAIRKR
jgi:hypothetical protein